MATLCDRARSRGQGDGGIRTCSGRGHVPAGLGGQRVGGLQRDRPLGRHRLAHHQIFTRTLGLDRRTAGPGVHHAIGRSAVQDQCRRIADGATLYRHRAAAGYELDRTRGRCAALLQAHQLHVTSDGGGRETAHRCGRAYAIDTQTDVTTGACVQYREKVGLDGLQVDTRCGPYHQFTAAQGFGRLGVVGVIGLGNIAAGRVQLDRVGLDLIEDLDVADRVQLEFLACANSDDPAFETKVSHRDRAAIDRDVVAEEGVRTGGLCPQRDHASGSSSSSVTIGSDVPYRDAAETFCQGAQFLRFQIEHIVGADVVRRTDRNRLRLVRSAQGQRTRSHDLTRPHGQINLVTLQQQVAAAIEGDAAGVGKVDLARTRDGQLATVVEGDTFAERDNARGVDDQIATDPHSLLEADVSRRRDGQSRQQICTRLGPTRDLRDESHVATRAQRQGVRRGGAVANDEERKAALANRDVARTDRDAASTIYPQ